MARTDPLAKQFYESFSDETNSTVILSAAGYLDSVEVYETKYATAYGGEIVERPEFSFLPNSTQALLVAFQRVPRSVLENPEVIGTTELPSVNVFLEPQTYEVLGSVRYFW